MRSVAGDIMSVYTSLSRDGSGGAGGVSISFILQTHSIQQQHQSNRQYFFSVKYFLFCKIVSINIFSVLSLRSFFVDNESGGGEMENILRKLQILIRK